MEPWRENTEWCSGAERNKRPIQQRFNKLQPFLPSGGAITALHQCVGRSDTVLTGTEKHSGREVEREKEGQESDTDKEPKTRHSSGDMKQGRDAVTEKHWTGRHTKTEHSRFKTKGTGGCGSADTPWDVRYVRGINEQF